MSDIDDYPEHRGSGGDPLGEFGCFLMLAILSIMGAVGICEFFTN